MKRSSWLGLFFSILSTGALLGACGDESTTLPDSSGEGGGGSGGSGGAGGSGTAGLSGGGQGGTAGTAGGGQAGVAGGAQAGVSGGGQAGEGTAGVSGGGQAGAGTGGVSGGGQAGAAGSSGGGQAGAAGSSGGGQAGTGGVSGGGQGGEQAGGAAGSGAAGSAGAGGKTPVTSCQQAKSTDCFGNPDCADTQLCTNLGTDAEPVPCCANGPRGTIADGAECTLSDDCQSGLCVPVDDTHSYCSTTCNGDQDCKAPFGQCISVFGASKFDWCFPKS